MQIESTPSPFQVADTTHSNHPHEVTISTSSYSAEGSPVPTVEKMADVEDPDLGDDDDFPTGRGILEEVEPKRRVVVTCRSVEAFVPPKLMSSWEKVVSTGKQLSFTTTRAAKSVQQNPRPALNRTASGKRRQVLYNINAVCQPGEVLALMGPSGGGKTTLLCIIGGRKPKCVTC